MFLLAGADGVPWPHHCGGCHLSLPGSGLTAARDKEVAKALCLSLSRGLSNGVSYPSNGLGPNKTPWQRCQVYNFTRYGFIGCHIELKVWGGCIIWSCSATVVPGFVIHSETWSL